jgi:hypothetical protein
VCDIYICIYIERERERERKRQREKKERERGRRECTTEMLTANELCTLSCVTQEKRPEEKQ